LVSDCQAHGIGLVNLGVQAATLRHIRKKWRHANYYKESRDRDQMSRKTPAARGGIGKKIAEEHGESA